MKSDLLQPLDKAVVGQAVGKLLAHMMAYVAQIERLEVAVATGMEEYERVITSLSDMRHGRLRRRLPELSKVCFFQFKSKIFAELIENTEDFY